MNAKPMKHISKSKTNWKKLHQQDDSDIDYSDIPKTDEKFWEEADVIYSFTHPSRER